MIQAKQIIWGHSSIFALCAVLSPSAECVEFSHAELRDGHRVLIDYYQQELSAEATESAVGNATYALDFDSFDLQHSDPSIELSYRYRSGRWMYSARFFRFRGAGRKAAEVDFNFARLGFQAEANVTTKVAVDTYAASVMYSAWSSDRSEVSLGVGLAYQDSEAMAEASFQSSNNEEASYSKSSIEAPLPHVRARYFRALNHQLSVGAELGWLSLHEGNAEGEFFAFDVWADYQATESLSLRVGFQHSNTEAEKTKRGTYKAFDAGFTGLILGLSFSF